jgi:hypothetical protein
MVEQSVVVAVRFEFKPASLCYSKSPSLPVYDLVSWHQTKPSEVLMHACTQVQEDVRTIVSQSSLWERTSTPTYILPHALTRRMSWQANKSSLWHRRNVLLDLVVSHTTWMALEELSVDTYIVFPSAIVDILWCPLRLNKFQSHPPPPPSDSRHHKCRDGRTNKSLNQCFPTRGPPAA